MNFDYNSHIHSQLAVGLIQIGVFDNSLNAWIYCITFAEAGEYEVSVDNPITRLHGVEYTKYISNGITRQLKLADDVVPTQSTARRGDETSLLNKPRLFVNNLKQEIL